MKMKMMKKKIQCFGNHKMHPCHWHGHHEGTTSFTQPQEVQENLFPEALEAVCCKCNDGSVAADNDLGICVWHLASEDL